MREWERVFSMLKAENNKNKVFCQCLAGILHWNKFLLYFIFKIPHLDCLMMIWRSLTHAICKNYNLIKFFSQAFPTSKSEKFFQHCDIWIVSFRRTKQIFSPWNNLSIFVFFSFLEMIVQCVFFFSCLTNYYDAFFCCSLNNTSEWKKERSYVDVHIFNSSPSSVLSILFIFQSFITFDCLLNKKIFLSSSCSLHH